MEGGRGESPARGREGMGGCLWRLSLGAQAQVPRQWVQGTSPPDRIRVKGRDLLCQASGLI